MGRGRAIIFTLLSGALTAFIIWLTPWTDDSDKSFAIGGVLFFGAATLVPLSYLIPARVPEREIDGSLTISNSTLRCLALSAALVAITAACFFMWPQMSSDGDWRRFVFLIIPIPCALLAVLYLMWIGKPAYRFDTNGLTRFQWGKRTTPWSGVVGVRAVKINGVEQVVLDLTPEEKRKLNWWSKIGSATGFGDLTLSPGATGLTPNQFRELLTQYWLGASARR